MLEIGAGTGANFAHLHADVEWIGLEPSVGRSGALAENARRHGHRAAPLVTGAEEIPLADASVDAVLATTVLCSVRDQAAVLDEAARVLVPGGRVLLAGLLSTQADAVLAAYAAQGCGEVRRLVRGDWTILLLAAGAAPVGQAAGAGDRAAWATDS